MHAEGGCPGAHFNFAICDTPRFISLYHPTNLAKSKEEAASFLRSRIEAFLFVVGLGKVDQVSLSVKYTDEIVTTMDTGE